MSNSIEIAKELKGELEKEPLIIEYRRIKSLVDSNDELSNLKREIALAKAHHDDSLHKKLLDQYNNHPLIVNYNVLNQEVSDYLASISQIVNKKWLKTLLFYL